MSDARPLSSLFRPALAAVDPYQPGRPASDLQRETGVERVVKLASNEGPFPPLPAAERVIAKSVADLRVYPDPGAWELREALQARLGVGADRILPGNGVDSLIKLLCLTLLDPGDRLVMGWPSFPSWRQGALMMGAEPVLVPLAADGAYDLDALAASVDDRTKVVVVVSPNNPTGGAVSADDLAAFLAALPDHVLPVLDEAYFEYMPAGSHDGVALLDSRPLVVTRTFSKIHGLAGLRVGYMLAPAELLSEIGRVRNVFDVNHLAIRAAAASVGQAAEFLPARVAHNDAERARMAAGLADLGIDTAPSAGNFLFFDLGSAERAAHANAWLLERGMIIRPTAGFGAPAGIRVTIGHADENDHFLALMGELLAGEAS